MHLKTHIIDRLGDLTLHLRNRYRRHSHRCKPSNQFTTYYKDTSHPESVQIIVSSYHLALRCPVFFALLSDRYGSPPTQKPLSKYFKDAKDLVLDGDNPNAILAMLKILRFKEHELPMQWSAMKLRKLAVVAHKYDVREALRPYVGLFFEGLMRNMWSIGTSGLKSRICVFWVWSQWDGFEGATKLWIKKANCALENRGINLLSVELTGKLSDTSL
ncbi:MAG: hypothetical protein MMC23_007499 [Stictis urceolatum]|nr:hypothetical protein [Stictis urceolata]